jgi:hypothetical protein
LINYPDQLRIDTVVPHLEKFTSVPMNLSKIVNLTLNGELILLRNVYCKLTLDNFEIFYTKLEYSQNGNLKLVTCKMMKNILSNDVQYLDIQLFMDFSSNHSFILSSNNQTYFYYPSVLNWGTSRIIDENNLNVHLNFNIPPREIQYKLDMTTDIQNETKDVSCSFTWGYYPNCSLSLNFFDQLEFLPLRLNFTLHMIHNYSKIDQTIFVEYLIYYKRVPIEHMKPFVISSIERKHLPLRMIANVEIFKFNMNFKFKCNSIFLN